MITYGEFIDDLIKHFPELKEEVLDEDYKNLISLQVGVLKRYTQQAINDRDTELIKKCFDFVADNVNRVEFKVENSLYLTFLNKLDFSKNLSAKKLLSNDLKRAHKELQEYDRGAEKNEKLQAFLKTLDT